DEMAMRASRENSLAYGKCVLANLENCLVLKTRFAFMNGFVFSKKTILQRFDYILNRKEEKMLKLKVAQKLMLVFLVIAGLLYAVDDSLLVKSKVDSTKFVVYDIAPKPLKIVNPEFPKTEKDKGSEGQIWLEVEVQIDGEVGEVLIVENSTGSELLEKSSIAAVKEWKFEPALKDGEAVRCWIKFPVKFALE
ncbi:MAG TPA: energy transducer TonB, partial [Candidatus Cloacimonetes bacterium]|nr:energy transducer TonB [Candidatus Cloacimonadota bacterium]